MQHSSTVGCFCFPSTRLPSISFGLKKVGKVKVVEIIQGNWNCTITIFSEYVSLFELKIDSTSSIAFLSNLIFSRLGIVSSFNFSDSLVLSSSDSLGDSLSCLLFIALYFCIFLLSLGDLLGKFLMLHHMSFLYM